MLMGANNAIKESSNRRAFMRFACAIAILVGSLVWNWRPSQASQARGYTFSDVAVSLTTRSNPDTGADERYLDISYKIGWETASFPGWLPCTIIVRTRDGSPIIEHSLQIADLTAEANTGGIRIPIQEWSQRPSRANVSCGSTRGDSSAGTYNVENVQIQRAPAAEGDLRTFEVTFDHVWTAASRPGISNCTLTARDSAGQSVFTYPFTLSDELPARESASMRVITNDDVVGDPVGGEVSCQPFDA